MPEDVFVRNLLNVVADDVVLCADAETGKTLWKAVFPGITSYGQGGASHGVPCVDGGRVFACTRYGSAIALDAATGKVLWTRDSPEMLAKAKAALEKAKQSYVRDAFLGADQYHLMAADGVVYSSFLGGAVDAVTGKERWSAKNAKGQGINSAFPLRWRHQDKWYFILGANCVEAATGKLAWSAQGGSSGGRGCGTAAVSDTYIVYPRLMEGSITAGLSCFRISADKAEKLWSLPPEMQSETVSPCIMGEHAYAIRKRDDKAAGKEKGCMAFLCVELATGKLVANESIGGTAQKDILGGCDGCSSMYVFADLICYRGAGKDPDVGHVVAWRAAASGPPQFVEVWKPASFDVGHTPAVAGGRLFLRTQGHLACYDMRKGK
jgi:outer membrane protein assembly factor BamB